MSNYLSMQRPTRVFPCIEGRRGMELEGSEEIHQHRMGVLGPCSGRGGIDHI